MDRLLTPAETADFLNCCVQTVYRNKSLPRAVLPGVGVRFRESEIENFIDQYTTKARAILAPPVSPFSVSLENLAEFDRMFLKPTKGEGGSMSKKKTRWNYGFGSVYLRKTKQGNDRWYVDYRSDGNRVREVAQNAQSRAEAVLYLKERVSEALTRACSPHVKKQITFTELGETYIENYAKSNKKSWKDDEYRIKANLEPFFGDMHLKDITPLKIERYRAERLKGTITKSTVNREITIMKRMFNLAIDWNFADVNPVLKVKLFSEKDTQKERILTEEEEEKLLKAVPDYLRPIIIAALNTGMRRGEILNLRWRQVDMKNRQIRVEQTKSGKTRTIPINDALFQELQYEKALSGNSEYVFPNPKTGLPYTDVKKSFKKACSDVGIDDLRFHDLRHTFATRLLASGVDIVTVRDLLGHFSVRITQRYTHSNQDQKREAVQRLSGKVRKQSQSLENVAHICHMEKSGASDRRVKSSLLVN